VVHSAARGDSPEVVQWLLDNGCDCNPDDLYLAAAMPINSSHSVLRYLLQEGVHAEPERLTATLKRIGLYANTLDAMKLLRQHGAAWPDTLHYGMERYIWRDEYVAWARAEGCTAPASV
jgi:Ankyrin repeat